MNIYTARKGRRFYIIVARNSEEALLLLFLKYELIWNLDTVERIGYYLGPKTVSHILK